MRSDQGMLRLIIAGMLFVTTITVFNHVTNRKDVLLGNGFITVFSKALTILTLLFVLRTLQTSLSQPHQKTTIESGFTLFRIAAMVFVMIPLANISIFLLPHNTFITSTSLTATLLTGLLVFKLLERINLEKRL